MPWSRRKKIWAGAAGAGLDCSHFRDYRFLGCLDESKQKRAEEDVPHVLIDLMAAD